MSGLKQFFKNLFCAHNYELQRNTMLDAYTFKTGNLVYKCTKCGKIKTVHDEFLGR